MKNKLIYLISVLFVAVACFSCSDDDDNNNNKDLIGTWNYSGKAADIHFEFEYKGDEISVVYTRIFSKYVIRHIFQTLTPGSSQFSRRIDSIRGYSGRNSGS